MAVNATPFIITPELFYCTGHHFWDLTPLILALFTLVKGNVHLPTLAHTLYAHIRTHVR